jgi:hypothetical protein
MEQLLECLLAKMDTNQAKTEANLREMTASQELLKEEMLVKMETNQERMEANHDNMDAKVDANQEKPGQMPIMRSLRSFEVLSFHGWISTKPEQRPFKKK